MITYDHMIIRSYEHTIISIVCIRCIRSHFGSRCFWSDANRALAFVDGRSNVSYTTRAMLDIPEQCSCKKERATNPRVAGHETMIDGSSKAGTSAVDWQTLLGGKRAGRWAASVKDVLVTLTTRVMQVIIRETIIWVTWTIRDIEKVMNIQSQGHPRRHDENMVDQSLGGKQSVEKSFGDHISASNIDPGRPW